MNINKRNLGVVLSEFVSSGIKIREKKDIGYKTYWDNLFVRLNEERKTLNITFIYYSEGVITKTIIDEINCTISAHDSQLKEDLMRIEEKTNIDINCLYFLIDILKEL